MQSKSSNTEFTQKHSISRDILTLKEAIESCWPQNHSKTQSCDNQQGGTETKINLHLQPHD